MRYNKEQYQEIKHVKQSLVSRFTKLDKMLKSLKYPSLALLNYCVSNVQYQIFHADDKLNHDIFNYYVNKIPKNVKMPQYAHVYDRMKTEYQFIWKFDSKANLFDIRNIESKPKILNRYSLGYKKTMQNMHRFFCCLTCCLSQIEQTSSCNS